MKLFKDKIMENEFYVYQLRVIDENLPFYVGKGKGKRVEAHFSERHLSDRSHKSRKIMKAMREGKQVVREFLKYGICEDDAYMWEVFYIAHYGRRDIKTGCLTNLTDGGDGTYGVSPETKYKMSKSRSGERNFYYGRGDLLSGENNPFYGRTHNEETKRIISEKNRKSQLGRTHTEETKKKIADSHRGKKRKPFSEEWKKNMGNAIRGRKRETKDCPHCGRTISGTQNFNRWHGDNCKLKP